MAAALRGLRAAILGTIYEPPAPLDGGERWFSADLPQLDDGELRREQRRLQLRLLLTDPPDRRCWPASWMEDRLQRVDLLLRPTSARRGRG